MALEPTTLGRDQLLRLVMLANKERDRPGVFSERQAAEYDELRAVLDRCRAAEVFDAMVKYDLTTRAVAG